MVLCQDTDYVLLDEPLNNLDMRHAPHTMALIRRPSTEFDKTVVVVLHDVNFAGRHADRSAAIKNGRVLADGVLVNILTATTIEEIFDLEARCFALNQRRWRRILR